MITTVCKCDGCGKIIEGRNERYRICKVILESDKYTDATGEIDCNSIELDFCEKCARQLLQILNKLVKEAEK